MATSRETKATIPNRWLGAAGVWSAKNARERRSGRGGEPPSASGSEECGGAKSKASADRRQVGTRPTEAEGDEDVRGNRRAKSAATGLTRPLSWMGRAE